MPQARWPERPDTGRVTKPTVIGRLDIGQHGFVSACSAKMTPDRRLWVSSGFLVYPQWSDAASVYIERQTVRGVLLDIGPSTYFNHGDPAEIKQAGGAHLEVTVLGKDMIRPRSTRPDHLAPLKALVTYYRDSGFPIASCAVARLVDQLEHPFPF